MTKSGAEALHGDLFDFVRDSALDARSYFSPERAAFVQQQPGGTIGGPLQKGRTFFFADYQATRTTEGIETGLIPVPTTAERAGDFSTAANVLSGSVNGPYWAQLLSRRLGYTVSPGEPYYTSGCLTAAQCVFPNAVIPRSAWSTPAQRLLSYIPTANTGDDAFSTGAFAQTVHDDKGSLRIDRHTGLGLLSGYYFVDDYTVDNPYPTQQGGASVPGFDAVTRGRAQLLALSTSTTFAAAVNEFHVSYLRNVNDVGRPVGGLGVSLASQGFVTGAGTPGIVVQAPSLEGVENLAFNRFTMGVTTTGVNQVNNTLHLSDAMSRELGSHLVRIGGEFQYAQVNLDPNAQFNGTFSFTGSETGSDFADFLLGVPSTYIQAAGAPFRLRNSYLAAFAQDTWRARPNLTLNYGLRWDRIMPWYEADNQIQAVVPGQQSIVYPGAPTGLVFPGDPGIARTLAPVRNWNFAPRVGISYAPQFDSGPLHAIFGDPDRSTVRASYGLFYTAFQGLSGGIMYSIPPFGYNYISPAPPLLDQPFITAADGTNNGQPFPHAVAPAASAAHPATIDWSSLVPVNGDPYFSPDNQVPFTESYMVSLQRELTPHTTVTASYVGSHGHRLLVVQPVNPGDPSVCLALSNPSAVAPGSATCGPFAENGVFTTSAGQVINGTRTALGADYGSITAQRTIGRSQYNALELAAHYARGGATVQASYTYSKSMDTSSNLGEQVNPFDPMATWAPSAFDLRHNLVVNYSYELPIERLARSANRLTRGWSVSGTTRVSSGFPVTLYNDTDTSLLGTFGNGVNNHLLDTPNVAPNCDLRLNSDPAAGPAFNTSCFSLPALGQLGNAPRRFFYGPGINNTDLAIVKALPLNGARTLQLRLEVFNVFDHPQFYGPGAVDGNITSPTFGRIVAAAAPRLVQLAAKVTF
ncbi:MAG TPA: TonB-dependent receptor [Vicinamibacterales bacterium]|nr:TonB-dependent receptor [Vicinamibacterales bacterium]